MLFSLSSSSALEFMSNCKVANLTVKADLTIDGCILQCESNPLNYLSCPIVSTAAAGPEILTSSAKSHGDSVSVSLKLQRVRVIYVVDRK